MTIDQFQSPSDKVFPQFHESDIYTESSMTWSANISVHPGGKVAEHIVEA